MTKAIIPAAGLGTRFLPATKALPKEMLPILDKPTIQYVVEEALASGVDEVLLVVNDSKAAIRAHFAPDPDLVNHLSAHKRDDLAQKVKQAGDLPVTFVTQESPLGLGHAVYSAQSYLANSTDQTATSLGQPGAATQSGQPGTATQDNQQGQAATQASQPFFVLLADVIVPDQQLLLRMQNVSDAHSGASVIAVLPVAPLETQRFGIIAGEDLASEGEPGVWRITGMIEKPTHDAPSNLAIFGRYLLSPRIMQLLAETEAGVGGEIQLTDALIRLLEFEQVFALVMTEDEGYDVGTVADWLIANKRMAEQRSEYQDLV